MESTHIVEQIYIANLTGELVVGSPLSTTVFLDMDDVLVVSTEYTSYQVISAFKLKAVDSWPELWTGLILPEARANLLTLHEEFSPQYVISSSWSNYLTREQLCGVFLRTNLKFVADNLHEQWTTPKSDGSSRSVEIEGWIELHGRGQPMLVLDDQLSGHSLIESTLRKNGSVVLCEPWTGFVADKLAEAQQLLRATNSAFP